MYTQFYSLKRNPFDNTPDPEFYCSTRLHDEGQANLLYGVQQRKGIVLVTGEAGTGKTLLLHCLMGWLRKNQAAFSFIFNPRISALEFLQCLVLHLQMPIADRKADRLVQLHRYLINRHRLGLLTVLIVDEGHLLDLEALEEKFRLPVCN